MVEPFGSSAGKAVGEATIVDRVAETAPTVKVIMAVLVKVRLSVVSTAEMVLTSATVDFIVPVALPVASVANLG